MALSILYVKHAVHPNKPNNQEFDLKAVLKKKRFQSKLNLE